MRRMIIKPIDVWTFGDGRPFEAGEDHHRRTMFPPTGLTIQGALRAKRLADSGLSFQKYKNKDESCSKLAQEIGWPDENGFGRLRLRGPWLMKQDELIYPLPADIVLIGNKPEILAPMEKTPFLSNAPSGLKPLWPRNNKYSDFLMKEADGWLSETSFNNYLKYDTFTIISDHELFTKESRFGVKIVSMYKQPQQGYLYSLEYVRLAENLALVVDMEGISLPESGWLALGGDSRVAYYTLENSDTPTPKPFRLPTRFKIIFITPSFFDLGWQPRNWDKWFPDAKLISVALKRHISFGGRDIAFNRPKPMRKFIPAGSVYYFESSNEIEYKNDPVTEYGAEIGFGQIRIGEWDYV